MKRIDEDIKKGQFGRCYLLFGEEVYLKKQYRDKLMRAAAAKGDTMNVTSFEGKDINEGALIDLAETLPFFAERRVILVEESGFFKQTRDMLTAYLSEINASACIIFVESEVDKRSKAFKTIKKYGTVVEFAVQDEALLTRWILGRIGKEQKKITRPVLQLFLSRTGSDMSRIDQELEKLLCYTMGRDVIEAGDVEAVVTEQLENKIFAMVDAIAGHNRGKALDLYEDLLALKEEPMRILYLVIRQFRVLLRVKELIGKGYGSFDIAKKEGIPEFAVRKNQSQAKSFTKEQLMQALREGAAAEEDIKTGRMNARIAVEVFIISHSGGMGENPSGRGQGFH